MPVDCCWWSGHIFCVRLRRLLGLGSFVPVNLYGWGSHCWCCDCDACWSCGPPAPAMVHGVPGVPGHMHCQVTFLSSGCRRRSASGGFDWRDVTQVAVPFACGLFSSVGWFYRSSSVRGSGPGVSSTRFWSLLHWRRLSVVLPAALVDCCLASLRAGVCSPPWRWRISMRVLMVPVFLSFGGGGRLLLIYPGLF